MKPALACLILLALSACSPGPPTLTTDQASRITTSSWPLAYLAQRLAAPEFEVHCVVPEGADPLHWKPDREAMTSLQLSGLVVLNGAGMEPWSARSSLPLSRVVDTSAGFREQLIEVTDLTHSHGPGGDHSHSGTAPHTWLDPMLALRQAQAIREGLLARNPGALSPEVLEQREALLQADLERLQSSWSAATESLAGRRLLSTCSTFDYLARGQGWELVQLALDPDKLPEESLLLALASLAKEAPAAALLWEREPSPEVAQAAAEASGLPNLVLHPAAVRSASEAAAGTTYLDLQLASAKALLQLAQDQ